MELSKGVSFQELSGKTYEKFEKDMSSFKTGFVKLFPYEQVLPRCFLQHEKRIKDFEVRPDDVWVASFPKCGTTWTQEMVWCIMNNYDYEEGKKSTLDEKFPYFEISCVTEEEGILPQNSLDAVQEMTPNKPRLIKTHLSYDMLPNSLSEKGVKLIYVTRNPRDTCVSFYNFIRVAEGYKGSLLDFTEAFLEDITGYYSPFIKHVLSYWNNRQMPNVLFIAYEEMKADLPSVAKRVADFLGKPLPSGPEGMDLFMDHLSFNKMKNNAAVNKDDFMTVCREALGLDGKEDVKFMRKGVAGDWKNHFESETIKKFEAWEKHWLQGSDLAFQYEVI